ncbi:MAG: hypothetical protein KF860_10210 [Cyclobacteriaceae bacterium]|nr:hypothetical protein [Cyclobacteriaceae bacterium]
MTGKIYSYVLRFDDGAAPNPFWDVCTLAICKPAIRRTAEVGDWVIGTGSKNARCNDGIKHDLSQHLVYAMRIADKMTLSEYNEYCSEELRNKIPQPGSPDWRLRMGDCIYHNEGFEKLSLRPDSIHKIEHSDRDLGGINVLLSHEFYYFGEKAVIIPKHLKQLIKRNQGHLKITNEYLIEQFEEWIKQFPKNTICGEPQLKHAFDTANCQIASYCNAEYNHEDSNEEEISIC